MVRPFSSVEMKEWLSTKNKAESRNITARCALRVIPFFHSAVSQNPTRRANKLLLPSFRALSEELTHLTAPDFSCTNNALVFLTQGREVADQVRMNSDVTIGTIYTSFQAFMSNDQAEIINAVLDTIARTRSTMSMSAFELGEAISLDMEVLASGNLILATSRAIWPDGIPNDVQKNWSRLKHDLDPLGEDWDAWTNWYEARLQGSPVVRDDEVARTALSEELWQQGAKVLNRAIKEQPVRSILQAASQGSVATKPLSVGARPSIGAQPVASSAPPPLSLDQQPVLLELKDIREILERLVRTLPDNKAPLPGGIGHNNPPEVLSDSPIPRAMAQEAIRATHVIENEVQSATPSPDVLHLGGYILVEVARKVAAFISWVGLQGKVFVEEAVKSAGQSVGKWTSPAGVALVTAVQALTDKIGAVVDLLNSFFETVQHAPLIWL